MIIHCLCRKCDLMTLGNSLFIRFKNSIIDILVIMGVATSFLLHLYVNMNLSCGDFLFIY